MYCGASRSVPTLVGHLIQPSCTPLIQQAPPNCDPAAPSVCTQDLDGQRCLRTDHAVEALHLPREGVHLLEVGDDDAFRRQLLRDQRLEEKEPDLQYY